MAIIDERIYTQCQCCSFWSLTKEKLCSNCKLDILSPDHENDLIKIHFLYRNENYNEIYNILKDCKYLNNLKWIYRDVLFHLRRLDELELCLGKWLEESNSEESKAEIYIIALSYIPFLQKRGIDINQIYDKIEDVKHSVSPFYLALYYFGKAHYLFNPLDIFPCLLNFDRSVQQAYQILPDSYIESNEEHEIKFIRFDQNGNEIVSKEPPPRYSLLAKIFAANADHLLKVSYFEDFFADVNKAINYLLLDYNFEKLFYLLTGVIDTIRWVGSKHELLNYIKILKELIIDKYPFPINQKLYSIQVILITYQTIGLADNGMDYLKLVEKNPEINGKFNYIKGWFYFTKSEYEKASEFFLSHAEQYLSNEDKFGYIRTYTYYKRCLILKDSITEKPLLINSLDFLNEDQDTLLLKYMFEILVNYSLNRNDESLKIVRDKNFSFDTNFEVRNFIFESKLLVYYSILPKENYTDSYYYELQELFSKEISFFKEISHHYLLFKVQLLMFFFNILSNKRQFIKNDIVILFDIAKNSGLQSAKELINNLIDRLGMYNEFKKKLEENFITIILNFNYLLTTKDLV